MDDDRQCRLAPRRRNRTVTPTASRTAARPVIPMTDVPVDARLPPLGVPEESLTAADAGEAEEPPLAGADVPGWVPPLAEPAAGRVTGGPGRGRRPRGAAGSALVRAVGPEDLLLGLAVLAVEVPQQLVVAVGHRHVRGTAVAVTVEGDRPGRGVRAFGAGGRHVDDLPVRLLKAVEEEGVEIERAHMRLVLDQFLPGLRVMDLDGAVVAGRTLSRGGRSEQHGRRHGQSRNTSRRRDTHGRDQPDRESGRGETHRLRAPGHQVKSTHKADIHLISSSALHFSQRPLSGDDDPLTVVPREGDPPIHVGLREAVARIN